MKGARRDRRAHREVAADGPGRPALSLCVIARNEAAFLDECLGSARQVADDIVVVDTGSTDDTRDVALRHGARVSSFAWRGDFSAARNESLAQARGEWILVLDCDEVIATADCEAIAQHIASGQAEAYRLTTRNYIDEPDRAEWRQCDGSYSEERSYRGWFPSTKVRLWRNDPAIRFEGAVHELVEYSLKRHGAIIEDCSVPVHHYGYGGDKTRPDEAYVEAGERKVRDRPGDLQARYELAIAYRNVGRFERALEAIESVVLGLSEEGSGTSYPYLEEELVHLVYGDILDRLNRLDEALEAYGRVADRFPGSYQAYNNMGSILGRKGDIAAAVDCYRRGLKCAPDNQVLAANLAKTESALERGLEGPQADDGAAAVHSLSCCLIVKDGAETLERCLASVAGIADEIVVVDTGSTDDSLRVAEKYGARTGSFAWIDDFAAARNASLELAIGDWILWMDADDYLSPADADKVELAKRLKPDRGLYFTLVNEGGEDRSRFRQVKMFPNLPEIRFERPVHETVVPSLERLGIPIVPTDAEVRHTGYADTSEKMRKQRHYLSLMLKARGRSWRPRHLLPRRPYLPFRGQAAGSSGVLRPHCHSRSGLSQFGLGVSIGGDLQRSYGARGRSASRGAGGSAGRLARKSRGRAGKPVHRGCVDENRRLRIGDSPPPKGSGGAPRSLLSSRGVATEILRPLLSGPVLRSHGTLPRSGGGVRSRPRGVSAAPRGQNGAVAAASVRGRVLRRG